jgi:hypothetical protein
MAAKHLELVMRPCVPTLLAASISLLSSLHAQTPLTRGPDGRTTSFVPGIRVLTIPNKPFSTEETIEWTRPTDGQGTLLSHLTARIVRDSQGRLYRERRSFVPAGSDRQSVLQESYISDPAARTLTTCVRVQRTCTITSFRPPLALVEAPVGPFDKGRRNLIRQSLGTDIIQGLSVVGTRETVTIAPRTIGNDAALAITTDLWQSQDLEIDLIVRRQDPREGSQFIHLSDLSRAEPDPQIFTTPPGYTIKDARSTTPTPAQAPAKTTAQTPDQAPAQPPLPATGQTTHIVTGIDLLNIPGKPFSAQDVIDAAKSTDGQGTLTTHIAVTVARDSQGRVYRELRQLSRATPDAPSILIRSHIFDPLKRTHTTCVYLDRVCTITNFRPLFKYVLQPVGPFDKNTRFLTRETLGDNVIDSLSVEGTRETTTVAPGIDGNDAALTFTTDFWYSADLQTNTVVLRHDPSYGTQLFHLVNLVRAEPDPKLFSIPAGFTLKDLRTASAPQTDSASRQK